MIYGDCLVCYKCETPDYLIHYGAKGQKWGVRRWQNKDGSYTPAGRKHYGIGKALVRTAATAGAKTYVKNHGSDILAKMGISKAEQAMAKQAMWPATYAVKKRAEKIASQVKNVAAVTVSAAKKAAADPKVRATAAAAIKYVGAHPIGAAAVAGGIVVGGIIVKKMLDNYKSMNKSQKKAVNKKIKNTAKTAGAIGGMYVGSKLAKGAYRGMRAYNIARRAMENIGVNSYSKAAIAGGRVAVEQMLGMAPSATAKAINFINKLA